MSRLTLPSPAKLNLFLKVVDKRPDGFHNIKTVFERINLCDQIILRTNQNGKINLTCDHSSLRPLKSNLVFQAACLLKDLHRVKTGVDIRLIKNIPVAAGLGGGSSNAATTLTGLNRLWSLGLSGSTLMSYGCQLGSDVPFFLAQASWAVGIQRGDVLRPLNIKKKIWQVLIVPKLKIYSREVFMRLNLQLTKVTYDVNILIQHLKNNNINKLNNTLSNDLEAGILKTCPKLAHIKKRVSRLMNRRVIFSGSGPSLFCVAASRFEAHQLSHRLKRHYSRVYVVDTV